MQRRKSLTSKDQVDIKHEFLWRTSNEMLSIAPTISKHLARSLAESVPDDGMSAFAQRMHCSNCGALMVNCKVRVRKAKKRTRCNGTACRNVVRRECSACGHVNVEAGAERGQKPHLQEDSELHQLRKRVGRKKRKGKGLSGEKSGDTMLGDVDSKQKIGAKTKKRKSKKKSGQNTKRDSNAKNDDRKPPASSLATSFLFEPL